MINHEPFDWGVRLTACPFTSGDNQNLTIQADIGFYKHNRGSDIRITFPGVSVASPLRLGDAQVWYEAMHALVNETRAVVAQMKVDSTKKTTKKKR
jgi:hypothetical protein